MTVDGEKLEHGKEKKLGVGMKINFGGETEYQVCYKTQVRLQIVVM